MCVVFFLAAGSKSRIHPCVDSVAGQLGLKSNHPKSALRHCTKISCAASDGDFCSIHPGAKTLVSLHICAGVVTGQCHKYQDLMR